MLNHKLLDVYTDYLVPSFSLATATGLSAAINQQYSHDQMTRFLAHEEYRQPQYWQTIKSLVRQIEQDDGIIVVDDTIEEKPFTDEHEIVCWHDDHTKGQKVKGIKIVNFVDHAILPNNQDCSRPLADEVIAKPESSVDPTTGRTKRNRTVSKNTLVRERLKSLRCHHQVRFTEVVFDSWFSSQENMVLIRKA